MHLAEKNTLFDKNVLQHFDKLLEMHGAALIF